MALQCCCWQVNLVSARKTLLQLTYFQLFPRHKSPLWTQLNMSLKDVLALGSPKLIPDSPFSSSSLSPKWSKFLPTHYGSVCYRIFSVPKVCSYSRSNFLSCISDLRVLLSLQEKNPAKPKSKLFKSNMQQERLEVYGVFIFICVFRGNLNKSSRLRIYEAAPANTKQTDVYTKTTAFF